MVLSPRRKSHGDHVPRSSSGAAGDRSESEGSFDAPRGDDYVLAYVPTPTLPTRRCSAPSGIAAALGRYSPRRQRGATLPVRHIPPFGAGSGRLARASFNSEDEIKSRLSREPSEDDADAAADADADDARDDDFDEIRCQRASFASTHELQARSPPSRDSSPKARLGKRFARPAGPLSDRRLFARDALCAE